MQYSGKLVDKLFFLYYGIELLCLHIAHITYLGFFGEV